MYQRQEFCPGFLFVAEAAQHGRGHGGRVLLLYATHHHAEVPRFDDHAHALGLNHLLDRFGNLGSQPFLNLQPPRKKFDQAWNFAQANHFSIRNISDVYLPEERQHVMLAEAEHFDVFHDDHFVVANREQSALQ